MSGWKRADRDRKQLLISLFFFFFYTLNLPDQPLKIPKRPAFTGSNRPAEKRPHRDIQREGQTDTASGLERGVKAGSFSIRALWHRVALCWEPHGPSCAMRATFCLPSQSYAPMFHQSGMGSRGKSQICVPLPRSAILLLMALRLSN